MTGRPTRPKLLVSIDEEKRPELFEAVPRLLEAVGVTESAVLAPEAAGVLGVWFPGNPKEPLDRLVALCEADPARFAGTHQWTPVDAWTLAEGPQLSASAERLARQVKSAEPFHFELRRDGRPEFGTGGGQGPTGRTLRIEIVGEHASLSLVEATDVLDVDARRRFEPGGPPRGDDASEAPAAP